MDISKIKIENATYNIKDTTARNDISTINGDISNINDDIDEINDTLNNLSNKKYVFISDSYGDGYTPDGSVTSWISLIVDKLGLSSSEYISLHSGGLGFSISRPDYNFINLINNQSIDEDVTDVFVCGGYNDYNQSNNDIISGISNFTTACRVKYPNAKIYIGFIGWSSNSSRILPLKNTFLSYKNGCMENNIIFIKGCEFALHNYFKYFASDGIHPNQLGQNSICNAIYNFIKNNDSNVIEEETMYFNVNGGSSFNFSLKTLLQNGIVNIINTSSQVNGFTFTEPIQITGNNLVEIATLTNSLIIGNDTNGIAIYFTAVINDGSNNYSNEDLILIIKNKKLYLASPHASGSSYSSISIGSIQIITFNACFNALTC